MKLSHEDKAKLTDPLWRLRNLYSCRKEGVGTAIPFRPRPEQEIILKHLIETPHIPAYIVKSRRLGMSTAVETFMADASVSTKGWRGLIIDQKQEDATKKMVEIVRFAIDSLPHEMLSELVFDKRNDSELRIRRSGEKESEDSVIYATTGGRGGDCSMLHVSEWGPIAATDPTRSQEIRTGTFPAARKGRRVVETTWYGGKAGDLWEMVKPILQRDPNAEGVLYFFPWHSDPQAIKLDGFIPSTLETYFKELADKLGKTFSKEQKLWFAAKKVEQGIFVKREYPSTLDEAFSAPVQGSVYGEVIAEARAASRVLNFEWDRGSPVFAAWDIGWADKTVVWLFQLVGRDIHWIWFTKQRHKTAGDMMGLLFASGIPISGHVIPHDGGHKKPGQGLSYKEDMEEAGAVNVVIVPQCVSIWPGINAVRDILKRSWVRVPACDDGLADLEAYHTKEVSSAGTVGREPVHDENSHTADGMRTAAEAIELGLIKTRRAQQFMHVPRMPDGSLMHIDREQRRRPSLAIS